MGVPGGPTGGPTCPGGGPQSDCRAARSNLSRSRWRACSAHRTARAREAQRRRSRRRASTGARGCRRGPQ
eukprot:12260956-Alexandrium_andersonii.AAC.1